MKESKGFHHLINIVYYLLSTLLILSFLGLFSYFIVQILSNSKNLSIVPINLTFDLDQQVQIKTINGEVIESELIAANASLVVSKASPWYFFFGQLHFLGLFSISMYGIIQLWLIVKALRKNKLLTNPFLQKYISHVKKIAIAFFAYAGWQLIFHFITKYAIIDKITINKYTIHVQLDSNILMTILWGFVILLLAEIFKYGNQLQNENELTV